MLSISKLFPKQNLHKSKAHAFGGGETTAFISFFFLFFANPISKMVCLRATLQYYLGGDDCKQITTVNGKEHREGGNGYLIDEINVTLAFQAYYLTSAFV